MIYTVYRHVNAKTREVFYVGMGNSTRPKARTPRDRSDEWFEIVNRDGYEIEIICENMSEKDAIKLENLLIDQYKKVIHGGTLVNIKGGTYYKKLRLTKEERRRVCMKPIVQMDLNNNIIKEWNGAQEVTDVLGYSRQSISAVCLRHGHVNRDLNDKNIYNGYRWAFKKNLI